MGDNLSGVISNCYSTGWVGSDFQWSFNLGGLVGRNTPGTISACFWDAGTSTQPTSDGGTGRTTPQMRTIDTFLNAGWDFVGTWCMPANDYPRLRWEDRCGE
jgi:hypothetical protein